MEIPELAAFALRIGLYASSFTAIQCSLQIGEAATTIVNTAVLALCGAMILARTRTWAEVAVIAFTVGFVGCALVVVELISVWRGIWSYTPDAFDVPLLDEASAATATAWSLLPQRLRSAVSLPYIGRRRLPLWLWPAWLLVVVATLDIAKTAELVTKGAAPLWNPAERGFAPLEPR